MPYSTTRRSSARESRDPRRTSAAPRSTRRPWSASWHGGPSAGPGTGLEEVPKMALAEVPSGLEEETGPVVRLPVTLNGAAREAEVETRSPLAHFIPECLRTARQHSAV